MALRQPHNRKIHKVPPLLRQEERNSDAYDPKVVSFGPYHHGKEKLQLCQEAKHLALQMVVDSSGRSQEFFLNKVLEVIADARNCYIDGSTDKYTDKEFAQMMLLDACFLILFMGTHPTHNLTMYTMYLHIGELVLSLAKRDIFLLENQIPFRIVMLLINLIYDTMGETDKHKGEEEVSVFLHRTIWGQYKQQQMQDIQQQQKQHPPLHLLEAFRRVLVWDQTPEIKVMIDDQQQDVDLKKHYNNFRSAKDLKAKGIHFRPSPNKSLRGINFKSGIFYGQLQLPTWIVSNLSKVLFSNMIAYELCRKDDVDATVISYVNFMKLLVDRPADVKELREKKILLTPLGSDEEVVRLYKELNTYGIADAYSFLEVKQRIQDHYDSLAKTWMAQLIHTYFRSPWSIIAWFAGILLLVLTILQTYFTINPKK